MPTFCWSRAPLAQRRIGGDAGAQQRRDPGRIEIFRHSQHEVLILHQIGGVAAVGHGAGLAVLTVIGAGKAVLAILFQPLIAAWAAAAGIYHATDADQIADPVTRGMATDGANAADDFVARHHRVNRIAPFVASLMQVRMAHAAEQHLNLHIVVAQGARWVIERHQRRLRIMRGIGMGNVHGRSSYQCMGTTLGRQRSAGETRPESDRAAAEGTLMIKAVSAEGNA